MYIGALQDAKAHDQTSTSGHVSWENVLEQSLQLLTLSHYPTEKALGSEALDQQPSCVAWQAAITSEMLSYFHSLVAFTHLVKLLMDYKALQPISAAH